MSTMPPASVTTRRARTSKGASRKNLHASARVPPTGLGSATARAEHSRRARQSRSVGGERGRTRAEREGRGGNSADRLARRAHSLIVVRRFLTKQSAWLKDWRRRYFILKGSKLFFSKVIAAPS